MPNPKETGGTRRAMRAGLSFSILLLLSVGSGGCGGEDGEAGDAAVDTLSRRQKDSLISTMPVPGAGVVGKALRAADSADARAQRHDTLIR
ncbi:MAG: hypothetical protein ACQET1_12255 [Gemmatimonadota bacterium]